MSYEYKGSSTPTEQSSLAGAIISEEEKLRQAKKAELQKKYRNMSMILVGIIVVAVVILLVQCNSGPPEQLEWSEWMEVLPDYATEEFYNIEEQMLYRSRNLETTSSTIQSEMAGWELYDTGEGNGEFGAWSDWAPTEVTGNEDREVETQIRYHYRDKETTSSSSATMSGWELADTTYAWSEYSSWSGWSQTKASGSDSRKVETKKQYSYRNVVVSQQYSSWGNWSSWTPDRQSTSDLKKEETRTVWGYYYYKCPSCGAHMHGYNITCPTWAGGCGKATIARTFYIVWSPTSWDNAGLKDWHGTGKQYTYINGELVFKWSSGGTRTEYRYATRSLVDSISYGAWSDWSDTAYSSSSTREVQIRTLYRYCDREQIPTYHFWRWGGWTDWSADAVSATDNRQVETTLYYRYRDRQLVTTYYFQRWGDWSGYSKTPVTASDTTEVETLKQYRFKSKDN